MHIKEADSATIDFVLEQFGCTADKCRVTVLGNGLVNSTYLVKSIEKTFVLQRINKNVFKQPEHIIRNAELIHAHLATKQQQGLYQLKSIGQVATDNGNIIVEIDEQCWRAIQYIPGCYSVESVASTEQAEQVAGAFALFSAALGDFPADKLVTVLPNFHNLNTRLMQLKQAIEHNPVNRLQQCESLVEFCFQQSELINEVNAISPELPLHVTHNDTKINNLLFSEHTNQPIAVIDLDTCMQGFLMNDFGDMVRTCCSNLAEDDSNVNSMHLKLNIFGGLAKAYVAAFNGKITTLEKKSLVVGAQLLPFIMAVRFLTDYIDGDNYYHTSREQHNLDRAINQFHLYKLLHDKKHALTEMVMRQSKQQAIVVS